MSLCVCRLSAEDKIRRCCFLLEDRPGCCTATASVNPMFDGPNSKQAYSLIICQKETSAVWKQVDRPLVQIDGCGVQIRLRVREEG